MLIPPTDDVAVAPQQGGYQVYDKDNDGIDVRRCGPHDNQEVHSQHPVHAEGLPRGTVKPSPYHELHRSRQVHRQPLVPAGGG